MKISYGTRIKNIWDRNGYGYAARQMLDSLTNLGLDWSENDKSADVEIWFDQPKYWNFSEGPYKIGYHPWESTLLLDDWAEIMNKCDEIWTPSPLIADWYRRYSGITVPVYVYEHGVDSNAWKPVSRTVEGKFKFLHHGAEAARKGGRETLTAFRSAFQGNDDVELNMKILSDGWAIGKLNKINIINRELELEELVKLYHENNVFVYPSWGEGFGLTPLQALATAMPTITVPAWAPYAQYLDPKLSLSSELVQTPYPRHHPGMMLKPNLDELVDALRYVYDNYESVEANAHSVVDEIAAHYDWDRLTDEAFKNLKMRLQIS